MTAPDFAAAVETRFGGLLRHGKHQPGGKACALEVASVVRGLAWTDDPVLVGLPDLRPLNDGPWSSDQARTNAIVPLIVALWDWPHWTAERRGAWAQLVAERTIREVVPIALRAVGLDAEAERCEREPTAASAADAAVLAAAAYAAAASADAAAVAVVAADAKAAVLALACRIWREAAE